jgi:hypothetical protein
VGGREGGRKSVRTSSRCFCCNWAASTAASVARCLCVTSQMRAPSLCTSASCWFAFSRSPTSCLRNTDASSTNDRKSCCRTHTCEKFPRHLRSCRCTNSFSVLSRSKTSRSWAVQSCPSCASSVWIFSSCEIIISLCWLHLFCLSKQAVASRCTSCCR